MRKTYLLLTAIAAGAIAIAGAPTAASAAIALSTEVEAEDTAANNLIAGAFADVPRGTTLTYGSYMDPGGYYYT